MSKKTIAAAILGGLLVYLFLNQNTLPVSFGDEWFTEELSAGYSAVLLRSSLLPGGLVKNKTTTLKGVVENAMVETKGTYGIFIKNLKTGESFFQNEYKVFEPGSLYKIWILATVISEIEKGNLKEDEVLSQDVVVLNEKFNIASASAEMTEGRITLSVKDALEQMITISHNFAALLLSERVGLSTVKTFLSENNFNESILGESPKTTPHDIALFFEKLYKGELVNEESTKKMLNLLKKQQLNDGLPKYLPQDVEVAHKTGDIGWFKHDAGIIFSDEGDYIIVVMSQSDYPLGAQDRIADVSRAVYEYFTNK